MPSYNSTARVPFKTGGSVKKPKVKRIILWKGKAKDWPGAKEAARQTRNRKADGGIIGFKKGGIASESARKKNKEAQAKSIGKAKKVLKGWKSMYNPITAAENIKGAVKKIAGKFRDKKAKGGRIGLKKGSVNVPGSHSWWLLQQSKPRRSKKAKGGEVGLDDYKKSRLSKWVKKYGAKGLRPQAKAKGGKADKNWIQGVNKSIKKRGTKGVCTGKKFGSASCKPGSRRYNLAKTFKKMARAKHASGGLVRYI